MSKPLKICSVSLMIIIGIYTIIKLNKKDEISTTSKYTDKL
jgi:hypothetical protein